MGRKKKTPKIYISKKKANSKSLSGAIRKQQEGVIDRLATSVVNTLRDFVVQPLMAYYTLEQAADTLGVSKDTFKSLVSRGIVPKGEVSPSGIWMYRPAQVKCLALARARFVYVTDGGCQKVKQDSLKQFIERYWPQEVYDERKGKWGARQADYSDENGFLSDYGRI